MFWRLLVTFALAAAPASAAQDQPVPESADATVARVAHRLGVGGIGYCRAEAIALPGFVIHTLDEYLPRVRAELAPQFGPGNPPVIMAVIAGSRADTAGLRAGDAILAIDGAPVAPTEPASKPGLDRTQAVEAQVEQALGDGSLLLRVRRQGTELGLALAGERGCPARARIIRGKGLNASSGRYIQLTAALFNFIENEDELALVIAHELAHNILKHKDRLDAQGVSRGLFRAFGKNPGRIRATENEADRLALRLMHAAGFDIGVAPGFWNRFGRATDHGIFSDGTHPDREARIALAEAEIAAIRAGQ